jgi:hypothetical protein
MQINITVEGGVCYVDRDTIPKGIKVRVRDYDCDGAEEKHITKDEDGNECTEAMYG